MNDFTKKELQELISLIHGDESGELTIAESAKLAEKIQSMLIGFDTKFIAQSHLNEASSLISHAMCLLNMKET